MRNIQADYKVIGTSAVKVVYLPAHEKTTPISFAEAKSKRPLASDKIVRRSAVYNELKTGNSSGIAIEGATRGQKFAWLLISITLTLSVIALTNIFQ